MIYARHITYEHALGICLWGEAGRAMNRRWRREKTDTKVSKSCTRVTRYRELKKKKKRDYNRWVWWGEGWTYRRVLLFVLTDYNERLTGLYLERRGVITWNSTILLFTVLSKHVNLPRELQIFLGQTLHKCLLQVFDTRLVPQQKQCHLPPLHYVLRKTIIFVVFNFYIHFWYKFFVNSRIVHCLWYVPSKPKHVHQDLYMISKPSLSVNWAIYLLLGINIREIGFNNSYNYKERRA